MLSVRQLKESPPGGSQNEPRLGPAVGVGCDGAECGGRLGHCDEGVKPRATWMHTGKVCCAGPYGVVVVRLIAVRSLARLP